MLLANPKILWFPLLATYLVSDTLQVAKGYVSTSQGLIASHNSFDEDIQSFGVRWSF